MVLLAAALPAQELQPRAYLPAPVGLTYLSIGVSANSGGLLFDPTLPIQDSHVTAYVPSLGLGGSLGVFGRSAQVLGVFPYVVANLSGNVAGIQQARYRSGLADSTLRFAINIHGARAMDVAEFAKYQPKTIVGVSLTATAPTGQYDPNVLINIGTNRWAVKPELGIARFIGQWEFETALGVWFYTRNSEFYGSTFRTQDPLGSVQVHVVRRLPRRMWLAFDGTIYMGGRTNVGNAIQANYESNTRFGATLGIPIARRQALRFAYFDGATTRVGTDISSISVTYQVFWQRRH